MITHRTIRPSWDDYWMLLALVTSLRSPDPNTQVGSICVSKNNEPLGMGYNGAPKGIPLTEIPWQKEGLPQETKYPYVSHAEVSCLLHAKKTKGSTLYCTLFPCNECAKIIIQAGIIEVVYLNDQYYHTWQAEVARQLFLIANIKTRQHSVSISSVEQLKKLFSQYS